MREYDYLFKLRLVGDSGVGKSYLLLRYAEGTYTESYISTIGVDFKIKKTEIEGNIVKQQVWDTAGQSKFGNIVSNYAKGAHGYLLCFDLSDQVSFKNLSDGLSEIEKDYRGEGAHIILVGTKCDLDSNERVVSQDQIDAFIGENSDKIIGYVETSAKENINVDKAFEALSRKLLENNGVALPSSSLKDSNAQKLKPLPQVKFKNEKYIIPEGQSLIIGDDNSAKFVDSKSSKTTVSFQDNIYNLDRGKIMNIRSNGLEIKSNEEKRCIVM